MMQGIVTSKLTKQKTGNESGIFFFLLFKEIGSVRRLEKIDHFMVMAKQTKVKVLMPVSSLKQSRHEQRLIV